MKIAESCLRVSSRRIGLLCNEDRIEGTHKSGKMWIVFGDVHKPSDPANQTTYRTNSEKLEEQILLLIKHNPKIIQMQIAHDLDVPKSTVKYYVSKLSKAENIKRESTIHNGK